MKNVNLGKFKPSSEQQLEMEIPVVYDELFLKIIVRYLLGASKMSRSSLQKYMGIRYPILFYLQNIV